MYVYMPPFTTLSTSYLCWTVYWCRVVRHFSTNLTAMPTLANIYTTSPSKWTNAAPTCLFGALAWDMSCSSIWRPTAQICAPIVRHRHKHCHWSSRRVTERADSLLQLAMKWWRSSAHTMSRRIFTYSALRRRYVFWSQLISIRMHIFIYSCLHVCFC